MKNSQVLFLIICLIVIGGIEWRCTPEVNQPITNNTTFDKQAPNQNSISLTTTTSVGFPDLTIDSARIANSLKIQWKQFRSTNCAVVEECATSGKRRLMRFDVAIPNFGDADLFVGRPTDNPTLFTFSPCHGHYHYNNFSEYRLKNAGGVVVTGRKQAFCLMDILQYTDGAPSQGYNCSFQGISKGWADLYDQSLDCQWLDITGLAKGNYRLEVVLKMDFFDQGLNVHPDSVSVPVTIR